MVYNINYMRLAQGLDISPPPILQNTKIDLAQDKFIGSLISRLLLFTIILVGTIFFLKIINAGYIYLTSIGEPAKIQSATKEITNAAIGLLLSISVFFIIQIIQTIFGIKIFI